MTPISSTGDKVPLRLHISQQFALNTRMGLGEIVHLLREQAARKLALEILSLEKCFSVKLDKDFGTQRADLIVMTEQEYADLMREQFKKGIHHAQGFMPQWDQP